MKINVKIATLTISLVALYSQNIPAAFNNDIDNDDFIAKIQKIENNIDSIFNEFYNKAFQEVGNPTNHPTDFIDQQSLTGNNRPISYYQQSTSSMSFANNDKAIKISEQKTEQSKIYTIHITDKNSQQSKAAPQREDTVTELKELQAYIKKNFHAHQAVKILQECLDTIELEDINKSISIDSSNEKNQQQYVIKINYKESAMSDIDAQYDNLKKHKNKKSNRDKSLKKSAKAH